jgi:ubiquinone/menaquinone biosynthesis C-methylase UbiE
MNTDKFAATHYRCPYTHEPLTRDSERLVAPNGRTYRIEDGIPFLINFAEESFSPEEERERAYYQTSSDSYDAVMDWVFKSFHESEDKFRSAMIDRLELKPGDRALETGAGTCRDSLHIGRQLGTNGELFVQDLSSHMLAIGRRRMQTSARELPRTEFFVGNAARLPFADRTFDAAFHFGGINLFTDRAKAIAEMARVVRVGGKVVFGDESLAPWLRSTNYGEVLQNSNKLYRHTPPIDLLPECARDVSLRWLLGNAYYLIDFRVGEGTPPLDLDLPIVGRRGGTHRTRFYGNLEGVTVEAKAMAEKAAKASGLSLHEWLDRAVRAAAKEARS